MENMTVSAEEAYQHLQRFTSNEITRLYSEVAGRDALIEKLIARIDELEVKTGG